MDLRKLCRPIFLITLVFVVAFANRGKIISSSPLIPCEEGSYFFGEKCYKIFRQKEGLTWNQASDVCKTNNGSLVTIDSKELQDFITAFLIMGAKLDVWIGLHDRQVESVYKWDDGSVVKYTNWEPREPTGIHNHQEDCVEIRMSSKGKLGMWNDVTCDVSKPFICQSNKNNETLSHDSRFCSIQNGGGWKYFNSCYHIVVAEKSWEEAEQFCQENFNGHLLDISGNKEEMFLNYIFPNSDKDFWIGIKVLDPTQLKWSSGWHVIYHNWNGDNEHLVNGTCALKSKDNSWTSASCLQTRPFVCESSSEKPAILEKNLEGWKCPEQSKDWRDLNGDKCYTFENDTLTWYKANYVCTLKGGTLAVIKSEEENIALHHYLIESSGKTFIGLHRGYRDENVFEWIDGTKSEYRNWLPDEPSDKNEKCVEIWTETMKWNDVPCSETKPFICSAKKIQATVMEEKEINVEGFQYRKQCNSSGDMPLQTMFMVLVGIVIISLVIGLVIYNFKTKGIQHFAWKNTKVSSSIQISEDSCELL